MSDAYGTPSFDLVACPWLPVLRLDGTTSLLSLQELFQQAGSVRRLVADLPTQEFALLRLLLAIAHDALGGPADIEEWAELWAADHPFEPVVRYLDEHRHRFDLLDPVTPFFQVAGLRTDKDDVSSLEKIVADVPNGELFFTMRKDGVDRLTFAEAARWVVHAHAFDTSGIKSGVVGDPLAKNGKRYPQGVGWTGNLGGVYAEGDSLRETLLLNLIDAETRRQPTGRQDPPAWRRPQAGAADGLAPSRTDDPTGVCDLYTWQSRRLRLCHDADGVTGVVLTYGDVLLPQNRHGLEPMTGWRRSTPQERKLGIPLVYMPREHDPSRSAWRGLGSLLAGRTAAGHVQGGEAASALRPGIVEWFAQLCNEDLIDGQRLIRMRIVGARYGTQQSVIDEIVDDEIAMHVILLHAGDPSRGQCAIDAVADAEQAVTALGDLATNLASAAGSEPDPQRAAARDRGFGALDMPYRHWLRALDTRTDLAAARTVWQDTVHQIVRDIGRALLDAAGPAAAQGRIVKSGRGEQWVDDGLASLWFHGRLNKTLNLRTKLPVSYEAPADEEQTP